MNTFWVQLQDSSNIDKQMEWKTDINKYTRRRTIIKKQIIHTEVLR